MADPTPTPADELAALESRAEELSTRPWASDHVMDLSAVVVDLIHHLRSGQDTPQPGPADEEPLDRLPAPPPLSATGGLEKALHEAVAALDDVVDHYAKGATIETPNDPHDALKVAAPLRAHDARVHAAELARAMRVIADGNMIVSETRTALKKALDEPKESARPILDLIAALAERAAQTPGGGAEKQAAGGDGPTTVHVTITGSALLRHCVELAAIRDGEDVYERQARTLDELGYTIVPKSQAHDDGSTTEVRYALRDSGDRIVSGEMEDEDRAREIHGVAPDTDLIRWKVTTSAPVVVVPADTGAGEQA